MSLAAIQRAVALVTENEIIVEQITRPLSEHLWIYLNFSTDPTFKDPTKLFFPDAGEYDYLVSQNGATYKSWLQGMKVTEADYDPTYYVAGLITHVKVKNTIAVTKTWPPLDPRIGAPIYVQVITARV